MIVDSSAIVAILANEEGHAFFTDALLASSDNRMSAGIFIELSAVIMRRFDGKLYDAFDTLMREAEIVIVPVSEEQARVGRDAYRAYGNGTGHPAKLNFGDCFSYALAKETGEPLLFKGDDFARTDIIRAA